MTHTAKTASITWNKILTVITETGARGIVSTHKVGAFSDVVSDFSSLEVRVLDTTEKKAVRLLESAGFTVSINHEWGFEWDVMLTASK